MQATEISILSCRIRISIKRLFSTLPYFLCTETWAYNQTTTKKKHFNAITFAHCTLTVLTAPKCFKSTWTVQAQYSLPDFYRAIHNNEHNAFVDAGTYALPAS